MRSRGEESVKVALFPGQGSQRAGMAEVVERTCPDLLEAARSECGEDPFPRLEEDTRYAQPAIFCTSVAAWRQLGDREPSLFAGHSLGEIAALVAAGALHWRDGVTLVAARGRLMSEAAKQSPGAMAVLRAEIDRVQELADRAGVSVANHNAPDQVVVSGPNEGIRRLESEASNAGIACRRLRIRGAFHTPALAPTAERFAETLSAVAFEETESVVYSCLTAAPFTDPRRELAAALVSPVRWVETLQALHRAGARTFIDVGPGKVMAGLVRRCIPGASVETNALGQEAAG